jgi:hypothetical protein
MVCVRQAWLVLPDSGLSIGLEGPGYFCQSLDLGAPVVREVTQNRPSADGTIDRTMYGGSRLVSANLTAIASAGARIDDVADNFGPFMAPSARPVLHYILDRGTNPERTIMLRPAAYNWPIVGAFQRDIQLQWVAPYPFASDVVVKSGTAYAGANPGLLRVYPLTFPRLYNIPGIGSPINATLSPGGDVCAKPDVSIYGPISGPLVRIVSQPSGYTVGRIAFVPGFRIDANHRVDVDTYEHTAWLDGDTGQSMLSQLDWTQMMWPVLPMAPATAVMSLAGTNTSGTTQASISWQDLYFT